MKLNFQHIKFNTGISRSTSQTGDAREQFADAIYRNVNGIRAHALAMKIYRSEGATEYTPDEVNLITGVAERLCLPGFIDGLREQLEGGGV